MITSREDVESVERFCKAVLNLCESSKLAGRFGYAATERLSQTAYMFDLISDVLLPSVTQGVCITAILSKEGDFWLAECVAYDVVGQGATKDDAAYGLGGMLQGYAVNDFTYGSSTDFRNARSMKTMREEFDSLGKEADFDDKEPWPLAPKIHFRLRKEVSK